jgi:hypothetical protein
MRDASWKKEQNNQMQSEYGTGWYNKELIIIRSPGI